MSRRPSGRLEVIQLMRMMDDMLEKAGVDQQSEELTELCQVNFFYLYNWQKVVLYIFAHRKIFSAKKNGTINQDSYKTCSL